MKRRASPVRIGLFSDIHANLEALTAVLARLERERPDARYCLGDVVGYGAQPNECIDRVRETTAGTIVGNHDAAVAGRMDYSYYYDAARRALDRHAGLLTASNLAWLRALPYTLRIDEADVGLCHGSPARIEAFEYVFTPHQARECLDVYDDLAHVTFIGHSHLCRVFALRAGGIVREIPARGRVSLDDDAKYVVSIGSVGQPRDRDNRASFVVYDAGARTCAFLRVAYDIEAAAEKIRAAGLDDAFAQRLFLGV